MAPIVKMTRKLSGRNKPTWDEGLSDADPETLSADLNIPKEFVSQMLEVFREFDKVM